MRNYDPISRGTKMSAIRSLAVAILILILCGLPQSLLTASPNGKQQQQADPGAQADLDVGRQAYVANCSRCHGLYATGGDGPNIQRAPITLANYGVIKITKHGVPGTMLTTFNLNDAPLATTSAYIRSL